MLLDKIPVSGQGEKLRWKVRCDWTGCKVEWESGHKNGPHYCPDEHRRLNRNQISKEWRKTHKEVRRTPRKPRAERQPKPKPAGKKLRPWEFTEPRCILCGDLLAVDKDCSCPKDVPAPVYL